MSEFIIQFEDLLPALGSMQTAEFDSLHEAVTEVTIAFREIVADHIKHGKVLTMTSVAILSGDREELARLTVAGQVSELLAGARASLEKPSYE